jgi:RNA ligase
MKYTFPKDMKLDEVRQAIANANDRIGSRIFIEAERGDHLIFNYAFSVPALFPHPSTGDVAQDREFSILRECRGLTFHQDGHVLARKFHKFFNLGEKPETQIDEIDWAEEHVVLAKEDGSMITPYMANGVLGWGTKMGETDVAQKVLPFVNQNNQYVELAQFCIDENITPLFEWCSRSQRIVLDYPEDRLILTAMRDNITGHYFTHDALELFGLSHSVDVVAKPFNRIDNPRRFSEESEVEKGIEGYIVRFASGHMLKLKTEEYRIIHGTVSDLASEKNVLALVVSNAIDDALPNLSPEDQVRVQDFVCLFNAGVDQTTKTVWELTATGMTATENQKEFAAWVKENVPDQLVTPVFHAGKGNDPRNTIMQIIEKHLGSGTRIEMVRSLWGGHRWEWADQMSQRTGE